VTEQPTAESSLDILPFDFQLGSFRLRNEHPLTLGRGIYAVTGAVGSGKSTLIKLLADPALREADAYSVYPFISYLSQDLTRLFAGNTLESLLKVYSTPGSAVGDHFDLQRFEFLCEYMDLSFSERRSDRLFHFSEGELQRTAIALAFAVESDILVLDEPLTALNQRHRKAFYRLAAEEKRRRTLLLISHSLQDIRCCADYCIPIRNGVLQGCFELKQFLEKPEFLRYFRP